MQDRLHQTKFEITNHSELTINIRGRIPNGAGHMSHITDTDVCVMMGVNMPNEK